MNHILKRRKKCLLIQENDDIKNVIKLKKIITLILQTIYKVTEILLCMNYIDCELL